MPSKLSLEKMLLEINKTNNGKYEIINFNGNDGVKSVIEFYCHEKDKFGREHGLFKMTYQNFVHGKKNCAKCSNCYNPTYEEALETIKLVNRNRYELVEFKEFKNANSPITFYCHEKDNYGREHGLFTVKYSPFINGHASCRKCVGTYKPTLEEALETVKFVNNGRYEILEFNEYKNRDSKIKFYCHEKDKFGKEHGEFILSFTNFVNYKCKCPKCSKCYKPTYQEALDKIKLINNNRYELINFDKYTNVHSPITFYCHEKDRFGQEHGEFQTSFEFFVNLKYGCPICKQSHMERELNFALKQKNINFNCQQTFDWLKLEAPQFIDFYIQDLNIAIECQGIQHFKKVNFFANDEKFQKNIQRDINKFIKCKENNIKLLYLIPKEKVDFSLVNSIEEIYTEENTFKTVNEIIEYINKISK